MQPRWLDKLFSRSVQTVFSLMGRTKFPRLHVFVRGDLHSTEKLIPNNSAKDNCEIQDSVVNFDARPEEKAYFRSETQPSKFTQLPAKRLEALKDNSFIVISIDKSAQAATSLFIILFFSDSAFLNSVSIPMDDIDADNVPIPKDATRVSFAIKLQGRGSLPMDLGVLDIIENDRSNVPEDEGHNVTQNDGRAVTQNDGRNVTKNDTSEIVAKVGKKQANLANNPPFIEDPLVRLAVQLSCMRQGIAAPTTDARIISVLSKGGFSYLAGDFALARAESLEVKAVPGALGAFTQEFRFEELVSLWEKQKEQDKYAPLVLNRVITAYLWLGHPGKAGELITISMIREGCLHSKIQETAIALITQCTTDVRDQVLYACERACSSLTWGQRIFLVDMCSENGLLSVVPNIYQSLMTVAESKKDGANFRILQSNLYKRLGNDVLQLDSINMALRELGLEDVRLEEALRGVSVCNLRNVKTIAPVSNGPLVSVIMTCFNSEATVSAAVQSIMEQSYSNIELIVVDDASTDNTLQVVKLLGQRDSRIKVVSRTLNQGTYRAKNAGLDHARGEFVVCQDSDDWAHCRKIEKLVSFLVANPSVVAVQGSQARLSEKRGIQRRTAGYIRKDASSLMYRREPVLEAVGRYDGVRAGADGEYQARIERTFGKQSVNSIYLLLSFTSWNEASLSGSRSEFAIGDEGIFSDSRREYRKAYRRRHELLSTKSVFFMEQEQE